MYNNEDKAIEKIEQFRGELMTTEADLAKLEKIVAPPALQEVILARRHVEDARMRLGVALGMVKGE